MSDEELNTEEAPIIEDAIEPIEVDSEPAESEEAAPSDDSNESPAESEPTEAKKKGGFQKRIDELTRQRYEADQRAAELQQQLEKFQQENLQTSYQAQKPTLEAYNWDEAAWGQAMEAWAEQGIKQQQEQWAQTEQLKQNQAREAELSRQILEKTLKASEKYPDFNLKVNDPSLPSISQISPAAYEALITSDNMGELAYYYANNPAEVYQLGSMSPIEAVRAITKLESKLTTTAPPQTKAPAPPSQLNGTSESVTDPDKLPIGDWMKRRNQQIKR